MDKLKNNIRKNKVVFKHKISIDAKNIIKSLLTKDPNYRLGNSGTNEIYSHP